MSRTSIIIVNYNGAKDTANCLRSLYASDEVPSIVVVDNTPHDHELKQVMSAYPDVHLISATDNGGFGRGNNLGMNWALQNTDCDYLFLLNNDAWVKPDSIRKLEQALDNHPDAGIAAPKIVFAEQPDMLFYGPGDVDWRLARGRVRGYGQNSDSSSAKTPQYASFASGCAMLIRRELLINIGGFNPCFFMYEEDVEFCLRAARYGYRIWYEPETVIHHVVQGSHKLEGDESLSVFSTRNKRLTFYVSHTIKNRIFNLRLHGDSYKRLLFCCFFPMYMAKLTFLFIAGGRLDGIQALYYAVFAGLRENCHVPSCERGPVA